MTTINPYLTFDGNCEEAFNFYQSVFGGEILFSGRFSQMPKEFNIDEKEFNKVMHISLPIGHGTVLMGSDILESNRESFIKGSNFSISIHTETKEEADRLFHELSQKGEVMLAMNETFWGSYFGTLIDPFGIQWMINHASK